MRARIRSIAVPVALALAASACIGGGGSDIGSLLVSGLTGVVRVIHAGGDAEELAVGTRLSDGDVVEIGVGGTVSIARGDTSELEVRTARRVNAELRVESIERIEVGAGEVLVTSDPAAPIAVASDGVTAEGEGTYRFDRSLSVRVGVYAGEAQVGAPSGTLSLPRLRQSVVAGRVLPREPDPLQVHPSDPWDQRFLGEVLDLDRRLDTHRRGYQAEFGRRARSVGPLRPVVNGGSLAFMRPFLDDHDSGDLLVGLVLAILVQDARGAPMGATFRSLMRSLDAGATWGLLTVEHGIPTEDVVDGVVRAIALRTGEVQPGTSVVPEPDPTTGPGEPTPGPSPTPSRSTEPSPRSSPSPSPSREPSSSPSPSPSPSDDPCALLPPLCEPL